MIPLEEAIRNDPARLFSILDKQDNSTININDVQRPENFDDQSKEEDDPEAFDHREEEPLASILEKRLRLEEIASSGGLLFSFMDHPDAPTEIEEEILLVGKAVLRVMCVCCVVGV